MDPVPDPDLDVNPDLDVDPDPTPPSISTSNRERMCPVGDDGLDVRGTDVAVSGHPSTRRRRTRHFCPSDADG